MEHSVFERQGKLTDRLISPAAYNLVIGLTLLWGFLCNWWMVGNISTEWIRGINPWVFFGGYFASCMLGVSLFARSSNPLVSFAGYNLVVVPFGLIVNLVVDRYDPKLVQEAIRITALVTVGMMILGTLFPAFFKRISSALTVALLVVIVVELVEIFVFRARHGILDWIVVLIFCGYIGYDWGRANQIPKTLDNAIDSAAALYMDIINLFLRILRILGRK
ncbi:Bax inhibitor-1 family protein [Ectopseudomonas alcaliphila]|jgi:FtsH-binding integral membrane protein|uniref:Bax inhibitor-1 family protein n=1 Tax=Ectopseudomonas alcaliphila TaxID=101564 RepID=A0A1G7Q3G8_9GAMM|nr:Bax inhibitor-1 family protein [Pseudomonas alcaliphila]MDX5994531.1 Bax inhibitor-1 family protein [Pseudomonas alcaliphila]SDF93137.1 Integral membrane protein, interacts with FtsH [Pseudomonas alcaliphila]